MTDNPFPNIWIDHSFFPTGRAKVLPSGTLVFALAAPVLAGNATEAETANCFEVTLAEVEEAARWARCWEIQRGAYERSFCR
jgi:hypothetical protein